MTRALGHLCFVTAVATIMTGCEYALSDTATRIRYALDTAHHDLQLGSTETLSVTLRPDHWPDYCKDGTGYRVKLVPYQGNKAVAVGDIDIACHGRGVFWTGFGSEQIYVAQELAIDKAADEDLVITLHKTSKGSEIIKIE